MTHHSELVSGLSKEDKGALDRRLLDRQSGVCFICGKQLDLTLHEGQFEIDHIQPLAEGGPDVENNFAIVHFGCNRQKGASDLRVARRLAEFEDLQEAAQKRGDRGANLGHLLEKYGGATTRLRFKRGGGILQFAIGGHGSSEIQSVPVYQDHLSGMEYFFAVWPLAYLHHDDRINPRPIGSNLRGLIEEFIEKRPQLHVALGWWAPDADGAGPIKIFDGQHKAAAQILLGVKALPVRVFVKPDMNVLLKANTNAGSKLRQVAFDVAVMRHLGNTLYIERVRQYQQIKGKREDDYSFSEKDLVSFFKGESREVLRYIVDAVRDSVTHNKDNRLIEFVEFSGKGADRPLAYAALERTFFKEFLYKHALSTAIDEGMERGDNPRVLEREQLVRLMSLFANVFFVGHWDPERGGRKVENSVQKGEPIPENHLRAWRIAREEILGNIVAWVRVVIEHSFVWRGTVVDKERLLHRRLGDDVWERIERFLRNLAGLPCWIDKKLSGTIFGAKQPLDTWAQIFQTGKAPNGLQVLAKPLELGEMIVDKSAPRGGG